MEVWGEGVVGGNGHVVGIAGECWGWGLGRLLGFGYAMAQDSRLMDALWHRVFRCL